MVFDYSDLCRPVSLGKKYQTSYASYPKYRNMACGRNCLYLKYIKHNQSVPKWETKCSCNCFAK